jgi:hypothetical protein
MPGAPVPGSASVRMAYKAPPVEGRFVDESLFGETAAQAAFKSKSYGAPAASATTASSQQRASVKGARGSVRGAKAGAASSAALVVSSSEVDAMRRAAVLANPVAERAAKAAAEEERKRIEAIAEARKEKIRSMEAARIAALPLSQLQQEAEDEKAARRKLAAAQREDATDDMKRMNSMLNQAITVAIRDRQVAEKKELDAAAKAADRLRELSAEVENLEAQQKSDEMLLVKKGKLAVVRDELASQLAEAIARKKAARQAIVAEELKRRAGAEGEVALERAERAKKEAKRLAQLADFKADNEAQIALRKARKEAELELDAKADAEALAVAAMKLAQQEAADKQAAEKERLLHLAATNVSKILDNRSAADEARQRREEELGARRERAKAAAAAAKQHATAIELRAAHYQMAAEKQVAAASMIEEERAEFERASVVQEEWLEAERVADKARAEKNAQLLCDLRSQMEEKAVKAKAARVKAAADEFARVAAIDAELAMRVSMRDKKVKELHSLGVDPRWANKLAGMQFKA